MPFAEASHLLAPADRTTIARVLRGWRAHDLEMKQVAANFVSEQQLDVGKHANLLADLAAICAPDPNNAPHTLALFAAVCAGYKLSGPPITGIAVYLAGHVSAYDTFRFYLQRNLTSAGLTTSIAALDIELRALAITFAADVVLGRRQAQRLLRNFGITGVPTWCTFVDPARNTSPFVPPRNTASAVCENYGLGKIDPPRELVVLTYLPAVDLRCPTIADAGTDPYFRPAALGSAHGFTNPLNRFAPFGASQPEAVHEVVRATIPQLTFQTIL